MSDEHDVLVVGGGVAALTAAMVSARLGLRTTVVADVLVGGQIINVEAVENYPGLARPVHGAELAATIEGQARAAGAEFVFDEALSIASADGRHAVVGATGELSAPAVVVATGSSLRRLGVPGEDRLEGQGVSYCGSCDGPLFGGRPVAVVGGGDSAADEALAVAEHAARVVLVVREGGLHAAAATSRRVLAHERIELRAHAEPVEVLGDGRVSGLAVRDVRTGDRSELAVDGVFVFAGLEPNTGLLAPLVELEPSGHVPTTPWMETEAPGIFAAGDIRRDSPGLLAAVAGDGATAAVAAHRYLAARREH